MIKEPSVHVATIAGIKIRAGLSAMVTALVMGSALFWLLRKALRWRPETAVAGSILATVIHYLSELWHQAGHARAAEETGFPMEGVTLIGPLGRSEYPVHEGLLPAETHIQRALGGPIFSFLLALTCGILAWLIRPIGGLPWAITAFAALDNLLIYTIGALLPLGFTDGSTILSWLSQGRGGAGLFIN